MPLKVHVMISISRMKLVVFIYRLFLFSMHDYKIISSVTQFVVLKTIKCGLWKIVCVWRRKWNASSVNQNRGIQEIEIAERNEETHLCPWPIRGIYWIRIWQFSWSLWMLLLITRSIINMKYPLYNLNRNSFKYQLKYPSILNINV